MVKKYSCIPRVMWLNINNYCNNNCLWCYEQCIEEQKYNMKVSDVEYVINTMSEVGINQCIIIGGEPTLHPNLLDIIEIIKKHNMDVGLITNGRKFCDEEFTKSIANYEYRNLLVSMHGWTDEIYQKHTNSNAGFKEFCEGINNLKKFNVDFNINTVLSKYTLNHEAEIALFLKSIGAKGNGFSMSCAAISDIQTKSNYALPLNEFSTHVMEIVHRCLDHQLRICLILTIPFCLFKEEDIQMLIQKGMINSGCHIPTGKGIVIKSNLNISPCNVMLNFEMTEVENLKNIYKSSDNFLEFWNSSQSCQIRQKSNYYRSVECKNCHYWKMCGGGCITNWSFNKVENIKFRAFTKQKKGGDENGKN